MTTIEEVQRKIEQHERELKQRQYQNGVSSFRIFPKFSVDTK